ncbi:MAG TPA: imidazole glycerol phosphate synthase subunit HisH [Caulobacteraceae bacterium]|nr:imidazole glycerol phosphate synthase subunit HisH [Caulobacteraceae bacterium]
MQSIALIDYGSGNLRSAEKALLKVSEGLTGARQVAVTAEPDVVAAADAIVLPGVGAFAACMAAVEAKPGLTAALDTAVRRRGVPYLGICVGMQLMATRGLEFGATPGFDWLSGEVRRIEPAGHQFKVPHMGWNGLLDLAEHPLFAGLAEDTPVYFTHSFAFFPEREEDVIAMVDHGGRFPAAVARDNMAGVQFHPEKSQAAGLRLLANFLEWRP